MLERQQLQIQDPSAHTFWHWVRFELVTDVVARRHADTVLDIGAGSGMLGDWMATAAPATAYRFEELSPVLDAALVEHFGTDARHDESARITSDTVVALLDVVEHVEQDRALLADLAARMDAGSSLVLTVPALQWAFSSWDTELGHYRRYSRPAPANCSNEQVSWSTKWPISSQRCCRCCPFANSVAHSAPMSTSHS